MTAWRNERIQRCLLCAISCWGPPLCCHSPDSIFPQSGKFPLPHPRGRLLHAPGPSPHAGLLTTGRSVPFPPPARRTFARTREGTSTRLGRAETGWGRGRRKQGWVMLREGTGSQHEGTESREQKGKPGHERMWRNAELSMGMDWRGELGRGMTWPEKVRAALRTRHRRHDSWSPRLGDSGFQPRFIKRHFTHTPTHPTDKGGPLR